MFQFLPGQDPQWRKSEFSVGPDDWHKCCIVVLGIQNPLKIFFGFMMKRNFIWQISNNSLVRKKTKFFRRIDRTQLAHNMKPNECFYKILWIVKHIVCKFVQPSLNTGKSLSWSGLKKKKLIGSRLTHSISGHF